MNLCTGSCVGPQFPSGRVREPRLTSVRSSDLPVRNQLLDQMRYAGNFQYKRNEGNVHNRGTFVTFRYLHEGTLSTEFRNNGMHDG